MVAETVIVMTTIDLAETARSAMVTQDKGEVVTAKPSVGEDHLMEAATSPETGIEMVIMTSKSIAEDNIIHHHGVESTNETVTGHLLTNTTRSTPIPAAPIRKKVTTLVAPLDPP